MVVRTVKRVGACAILVLAVIGAYRLGADQPPVPMKQLPLAVGPQRTGPFNNQFMPEQESALVDAAMAQAMQKIVPQRLPVIPDNPAPHEGAMIDYPIIIEPPDYILVELLEALPGRPLSGTRLVRSDGTITLGFYGDVNVRGLTLREAKVKILSLMRNYIVDEVLGLVDVDETGKATFIDPADSSRLYLDFDSYNSKHYTMNGDVVLPGRYPSTGNDTVLDALQFAGGLLPSAEPRAIRLVRPAQGGKPAKVYRVDLEAIVQRGDPRTNYQLFPGDRIYVDRNDVVKTTVEINRLAEPISLVLTQLLNRNAVLRSLPFDAARGRGGEPPLNLKVRLGQLTVNLDAMRDEPALTPAQREAMLRPLVEYWWKATHPEGATLDEKRFFEGLIPTASRTEPTPRPK